MKVVKNSVALLLALSISCLLIACGRVQADKPEIQAQDSQAVVPPVADVQEPQESIVDAAPEEPTEEIELEVIPVETEESTTTAPEEVTSPQPEETTSPQPESTPAETTKPVSSKKAPSQESSKTEKPAQEASKSSHKHKYSEEITEPTCSSKGYTTYTCSCGDSYKDDYVEPTSHDWGDWTITKKPTTTEEGESIRYCRDCNTPKTIIIDKLEPVDPATCDHKWKKTYYAEEGHYTDYYCVCKCGWRFEDPKEWEDHIKENRGEAVQKHTSWSSSRDYIIDVPEYFEWVCTECGEKRNSEP